MEGVADEAGEEQEGHVTVKSGVVKADGIFQKGFSGQSRMPPCGTQKP